MAKNSNANYTLTGRITDLKAKSLEGLVIRAFDQDPKSADDPLGQAITDAGGQYTIRFEEELFKPGGETEWDKVGPSVEHSCSDARKPDR